ncbi:IS30 family transposase [Candidatus Peregrinibacteria bacterium]|nr:MAG: IS30 family transposase [Candidatus Peregrinibacteria bacterium]QQR54465.1 MAG: IS30 family transposase [Candidatus Peregrinibacteria bacterium]QQR54472.1 MAG: IS30 family transposase [Candidatus Peregrinibacteria bacterium]QQR54523.1 MAG: IS30 family transposase [Candidatus Peregrinibacteria bacterium]QQR54614.1 MAG: IS30 family transposase [Candidatus Peregrinibacteria bacterium]
MTTDNDILFQKHKELEKLLGIKIYFCHPYHSWEKGTVENTNKIIRKDIPKGSDISKYSKAFIQRLEEKLNRRPLKCLNYLTPKEALLVHREITKLKKS